MKLISTIYTVIGVILAMFCIVTFGYILQTKKVKKSIEDVLETSNTIREGELAQKLILDLETGLRGYLLTGETPFLEPFYEGQIQFSNSIERLDSLTKESPAQNQVVHLIEKDAQFWIQGFAVPLVRKKSQAHLSPQLEAQYDSLFEATAKKGVGKAITDRARARFSLIRDEEEGNKRERVNELETSLARTNEIAVGLTVLSILIGCLMAYLLGKTIRNRFQHMNTFAHRIANGDYSASVADNNRDEISSLTLSLNIMASKLQESFNHLNKVNKELDQFAYVVSHDLKAPLRAINNLAEWIAEDLHTNDADILKNFSTLRGRVQRMENLINGILDYSRVGKQSLPMTTFSVEELLKETLDALAPPPEFKIHTPTPLPVITGERTLFYQILSNLLSNAFKYHHGKGGQVHIRAQDLEDFYQFEVQDDGPGIPKEFHDKVFGIFQTMDARDVKESTGVGLSIVKKIIEEKGGNIWIESEKDQGTTFLFTWPKKPFTDIVTLNPLIS